MTHLFSVTGLDIFPLYFCAKKWVAHKKLADRLLELWENLTNMNLWQSLPKSKWPSCKSYKHVKAVTTDALTPPKSIFFTSFASDAPMIQFLYSDLVALFHSTLELVVKPDVLNECCSDKDIMKLNLDQDLTFEKILKILKIYSKIFHLGYFTKALLNDLKIWKKRKKRFGQERCNG